MGMTQRRHSNLFKKAGYDNNSNYGSKVAGDELGIGKVEQIEDCLRSKGIIK